MGNIGFAEWLLPLIRFAPEGAACSLTAGAPDVTGELSDPWALDPWVLRIG